MMRPVISAVFAALVCLPARAFAQQDTTTHGLCPATVRFHITESIETGAEYQGTANLVANAFLKKVTYTFFEVGSTDDLYDATGNWWNYPYECVLHQFSNFILSTGLAYEVPLDRLQMVEDRTDDALDGYCDYQLIADGNPECEGSSGGGSYEGGSWYYDGPDYYGDDPPDTSEQGSEITNLCESLQLTPGTYDIYVDGSYDSTITC
jgi:hypothetical protein